MLIARLRKLNPYLIALLLLTIYGFIVRIYNLDYQSFWYDEGYSVNAALCMLERGLPILPSGHFYTPGLLNTGVIASSMGLFGVTEFSARLPSVIFGTLTIPLVFFFANRIGDKKLALITAFLVTFSMLEIAWSREARMYQQLQFFYILSLYLFYEFTQRRNNRYLILTIVSTICTVLSHMLGFSLILIYPTYFLLANIRSIRRYISREFLLNRQTLILALCAIALLSLGELFFGLFSTVWGTRMNYFAEYWGYLKGTLPVILYLSVAGAIILLRSEYKISLLLILAIAIPFYFICFHIKLLSFRYLYFMLPIFFVLFAVTVIYLSNLIPRNKLKHILSPILAVTILGLTVYSSGFNFTPQSIYYLEPKAPQPNFKQAYYFINENMSDSDIIIDTWPALGKFYLENAPDYWLAFDIAGLRQDYCAGEDNSREFYTNTLCIETLDMLVTLTEKTQSGWLVIDGLAWYRLPPSTTSFIERNLTYYDEGSSRSSAGWIRVYGWNH